ncbi:hypothetical protein HPG69_013958 [Diceros bicornis minor]|uniref:Vomeronasal type-1 receptor n=1 Tax=Diceros bicornis minor TaxID=77932 RepID=A0A7J7EN48_DICBM|nr:hypothetical protein HPG69_013958 [Diceros bicornis minor]
MAGVDLKFEMIFLVHIFNCSLLYHYIKSRLRPMDLILRHLTIANLLVILSRGIPGTMAPLGEDISSTVLDANLMAMGLTIGITCLLSVFQAITRSSRNSGRAELKVKVTNYVVLSSILCWILHMLVNFIFPMLVTGKRSKKSHKEKDFEYRSTLLMTKSQTQCVQH